MERQRPADLGVGAEGDGPGADLDVAVDPARDRHGLAGQQRIARDRSRDMHRGSRRPQIAAHGAIDADIVARDRGVAADGRTQQDIHPGGVEIAADLAQNRQTPARHMRGPGDRGLQRDAIAREKGIVGTGPGVDHVLAGKEDVVAEGPALAVGLRRKRRGQSKRAEHGQKNSKHDLTPIFDI